MSGGDDMQDLVGDFVTESREHLANVETDLLRLEQGGSADQDTVNKVFRCVHSVKGVAGFLGFERINELAHTLESTLDLVRKDRLQPTRDLIGVLLEAIDQLRAMIENAADSNNADIRANLERLRRFLEVPPSAAKQPVGDGPQIALVASGDADGTGLTVSAAEYEAQVRAGRRVLRLQLHLGEIVLATGKALAEVPDLVGRLGQILRGGTQLCETCAKDTPPRESLIVLMATDQANAAIRQHLQIDAAMIEDVHPESAVVAGGAAPVAMSAKTAATSPAPVASAPPAASRDAATPAATASVPAAVAATPHGDAPVESVRVSVQLLDRLMNLSGELVLGRNQLLQAVTARNDKGIELAASRLNAVVSEVQEAVMQTRMQPIGNVFQRFPRVVRDLAGKLGKKCRLVIEGKDVDLDRSILEGLADPLTHLVRNAVDHGIEKPELRAQRGKPAEGTLQLQAFHQGGNVKILIIDDGGGIDPDRLRKKAVEKGDITPEVARTLGDREAIHLIFAPGFSTAEKVTDVSGRGVGMDVVRSNIEKLGGNVDVQSVVGRGSTITITIPLTLAILPSLVVSCGERRYVLPQSNISELVRIRGDGERRVMQVKGRDVFRLRGKLLPVVHLRDVLAMQDEPGEPQRRAQNIMVVESGHLQYGLVVDTPPDAEEIVVKSLGRHLKGRPEYAGSTILGDGRVAMILDVGGVADAVGLTVGEAVDGGAPVHASGKAAATEDSADLVLFKNHPDESFAIPLGLVNRIQRLERSQITAIGSGLVLGSDDKAMPLVRLEQHVAARAPEASGERVSVVILRVDGLEFGLIAPEIEDIRNLTVTVDDRTLAESGVLGSFQLQGRTVRLLDIAALARRALPHLMQERPVATVAAAATIAESVSSGPARVLFAEDSNFFRGHVQRILEAAGFAVTSAADGDLAWQELQKAESAFDIVVTDIQMPNCDGLELTRRVRRDQRWQALPVLALTSLSSQEDIDYGKAAGVTDYRIKLDDAALVAAVRELTGGKA